MKTISRDHVLQQQLAKLELEDELREVELLGRRAQMASLRNKLGQEEPDTADAETRRLRAELETLRTANAEMACRLVTLQAQLAAIQGAAPAPAPAVPDNQLDLPLEAAAAAAPSEVRAAQGVAGGGGALTSMSGSSVPVFRLMDLKTTAEHGYAADRAITIEPIAGLRGQPDLPPGTLLQVAKEPFGGVVRVCDYQGVTLGQVDALGKVVLDLRPLEPMAAAPAPKVSVLKPVPKKRRRPPRAAAARPRRAPAPRGETVVYEDPV